MLVCLSLRCNLEVIHNKDYSVVKTLKAGAYAGSRLLFFILWSKI